MKMGSIKIESFISAAALILGYLPLDHFLPSASSFENVLYNHSSKLTTLTIFLVDVTYFREICMCNIIGDELLLNFGAKFQR